MRRLTALCLAMLMVFSHAALASASGFEAVTYPDTDAQRLVKSYDKEVGQLRNNVDGYTFLTFGRYPYTAEGDVMPVLWKVLRVENGYAFCYTQYVIDFAQYHTEKVDLPVWKDNLIYTTLNETIRAKMFTEEELTAVAYSDDRGWLFYLSNFQLRKEYYGFRHWQLAIQKPRECAPTPYAMTHPEAFIDPGTGNTWYFSTDIPHPGCHSLLGYDGHTSTAANNRYGGVRPACYIDLSMLDNATGSGTVDDPYVFELITDYSQVN